MDQKLPLEEFPAFHTCNYKIKEEVDDKEFEVEELHHSIDIKEESTALEPEQIKCECYLCGIQFHDKSQLIEHLETQCLEKPFSCEICALRYLTKQQLNRHTKTHIDKFAHNEIVTDEENRRTYKPLEIFLKADVYDDVDYDGDGEDEKLKNKTGTKKHKTPCKFCQNEVTNFERHLERNHSDEEEVLQLTKLNKHNRAEKMERKKILSFIRNEAKFDKFIHQDSLSHNKELLPCSHCKRLLSRIYLRRHFKTCVAKPINDTGKNYKHISKAQTLVAFASNTSDATAKLRVRDEVFSIMAGDDIAMVAKTDFLILQFGENYLQKYTVGQVISRCSNKMRELARLLIEVRKQVVDERFTFIDLLNPRIFDMIKAAAKAMGGYSEVTSLFSSPSTPLHLATSLKQICDLFSLLLTENHEELEDIDVGLKLIDLKQFRFLVENQWVTKVFSPSLKGLAKKVRNKPRGRLERQKMSHRVRWSSDQKQVVEDYFQQHIQFQKAPKKQECLELKGKHSVLLENLDWVKIKTYVYNVYKNL